MRVYFSDPAEFLDELFAEAEQVEDKILRLTRRYRRIQATAIQNLEIVASCVVRGKILLLEHYVGELWRLSHDVATKDRADQVQARIEARAQELGLTVRLGVFEEG